VKKVRTMLIATAAATPAAMGMVFPAAANASATVCKSYRVLSPNSDLCIGVRGTGNWVNGVKLSHWSTGGTGYVGYTDVPGYPAKSKWRAGTLTGYPGSFSHAYWWPNCSFPTGAHVYGWTNHWPFKSVAPYVRIHGSTYTGTKKCA